ncbi:hypothetical protein [Yinghuangia seranimata]|uniref:hypothetical protein n=1 Tax=Yinghuangia seranimata TaxID=408067 RepID=UPI00248C2B10|nr:hypothetical protein [Yinghuangia seranimata]MDI2130092.1 hypothetical protein [Yinghuangia seranimata]
MTGVTPAIYGVRMDATFMLIDARCRAFGDRPRGVHPVSGRVWKGGWPAWSLSARG